MLAAMKLVAVLPLLLAAAPPPADGLRGFSSVRAANRQLLPQPAIPAVDRSSFGVAGAAGQPRLTQRGIGRRRRW